MVAVFTPFQIVFNEVSAAELARMPKELQLKILGHFRGLPEQAMTTDLKDYGRLTRAGKVLYRFRLEDYRVYFERHPLGIRVHRILSKNTLQDFLYRSALPVSSEDEILEEDAKFWKLIDDAKATEDAASDGRAP